MIITSPSDKNCIIDTFKDFFASIKERATGLKGYAIMHNDVPIESTAESVIVVLTFWNSRDDMDDYYKPENKHLSQLVASLKQMPERTSYNSLSDNDGQECVILGYFVYYIISIGHKVHSPVV